MIVCGIVGSAILGPTARRFKVQEEVAKGAYSISCIFMIVLCLSLRESGLLPVVIICLAMVGAAGMGPFPLLLELAVEEAYPADPVFTEALIHMSG